MKYILIVLLFMTSLSIALQAKQIDIQGHRGARGILPENSIPGFLAALDSGATTIEIDVVVSKDGLIVVSHEPYMNHDICLDREGNRINKSEGKEHNIYQYNYDEIKKFDCGSIGNPNFPEQLKIKVSKPFIGY
jgi:glycerophosphoryl diester phosphodiesterase